MRAHVKRLVHNPSKYSFLIVSLLFVSFSPYTAEAHIIGGEMKRVGDYTVAYKSIPSNPLPGSDVTLAFSILSENADIPNVLAGITVMKENNVVAEIPEQTYATGDISLQFVFPEDGAHRIIMEAEIGEDREPVRAVFEQFIGRGVGAQSGSADIGVGNAVLLSLAFGVVPLYIGLTNSKLSRKLKDTSKGFVASVAFGIVIFSLFDLLGGASRLGIDFGLRAVHLQATFLLAFAAGLAIPFLAERYSKKSGGNRSLQITAYGAAYLFALAVAFHSFAEGVVVGYDLQTGYSFTFAQRSLQGTSFVLHKIAEGFVISIPLMLGAMWGKRDTETFVLAGILGAIPLSVGVAIAYLGIPGLAASYGFALGAGVFTYVLFKLAHLSQMLAEGRLRIFAGIIIGVLFMYLAGWIHSIQ